MVRSNERLHLSRLWRTPSPRQPRLQVNPTVDRLNTESENAVGQLSARMVAITIGLLLWFCNCGGASKYCVIRVVDEDTGRGVPDARAIRWQCWRT